jgi:hypothetical protein
MPEKESVMLILTIEQGISNKEGKFHFAFVIRCSIFDTPTDIVRFLSSAFQPRYTVLRGRVAPVDK